MDDEKKQSPEASSIYANDYMELAALNEQDAINQTIHDKPIVGKPRFDPWQPATEEEIEAVKLLCNKIEELKCTH